MNLAFKMAADNRAVSRKLPSSPSVASFSVTYIVIDKQHAFMTYMV